MKQYVAIYKRLYRAMKREFKLLYELNAKYLDDEVYFRVMDDEKAIARADYDHQDLDICPEADPKMVTDMQRLGRAQVVFETAQHPLWGAVHKPVASLRRFYEAVGVEELDEVLKTDEELRAEQQAAADAAAGREEAELEGVQKKAMRDEAAAIKDISSAEGERRQRDADQFGQEFGAEFAEATVGMEGSEGEMEAA